MKLTGGKERQGKRTKERKELPVKGEREEGTRDWSCRQECKELDRMPGAENMMNYCMP